MAGDRSQMAGEVDQEPVRWVGVGETIDAGAFKALVKAAVAQNGPRAKKR